MRPEGAFDDRFSQPRAHRLSEGWSANLLQMALGIAQQVALVPIFLHYWSNDILAAWLAIYAAGNLVLIVDAGLQFRAINRFLAFKSSADCDRRSGQFYVEMLRIYLGLAGTLAVLLVITTQFLSPSVMLGFRSIAQFDLAFGIMVSIRRRPRAGHFRLRRLDQRSGWRSANSRAAAHRAVGQDVRRCASERRRARLADRRHSSWR
jgi:hypothetical protein